MSLPRTLAAAGAVLALGMLAGCSDDEPTTEPTPSAPTSDVATESDAATPSTGTPGGEASAVPAYYVGTTPQGDRLYREFIQVTGADRLVATAAAVTSGDPVDPDYRTLWPKGRFASVARSADAIEVELADDSWLSAGSLAPPEARLAVQQLVYSLQGAAGERLPVRVTHDGKPATTLLGEPVGDGLAAAPELDVLALVNVTEPAEGTAVGDTFTATGRASSFEATVPWEVQDSSGTVVLDGFATAEGWVERLYPWSSEVDVSELPAGTYTFVARTDDPSGGEGGGPTEDTKRITIK
ncbi:Gmad2 immunoglobulin-like domain-containing protein [Pimelobacter simplex]|uniref:Gmad2 immunoglobulin-like domain-containing protein n=1 Tax=Nocardioides simplex TaxID=2045 RepID=UPI001932AF1B|nr:GerMN domain-containing protein [Pimelobacter simplex]